MFLKNLVRDNPAFIETITKLHRDGSIPPNSFVYDLDMIANNAATLAASAKKYGLKTYLMTKQFNRNPFIVKTALKMGLDSTVSVDITDAKTLNRFEIPLGHVGHLVQIPTCDTKKIVAMHPEVITVYNSESAQRISDAACALNIKQSILLKVCAEGDDFFPGQESGIWLPQLLETAKKIMEMPGVQIVGATAFPCVTYNCYPTEDILPTPNFYTLMKAITMLRDVLNIEIKQVNAPGNTATKVYPLLKKMGATHVEPGHGLTATTPDHIYDAALPEKACSAYVSEISHHFRDKAYAYGGGLYVCVAGGPKGYPVKALVGSAFPEILGNKCTWEQVSRDNIDYYGMLTPGEACRVGDTVIFGYRSQVFITRAMVTIIAGVQSGKPEVVGIFDHAANMVDDQYDVIAAKQVIAKIESVIERY